MQAREGLSLEQIRAFLEASDELGFQGRNRDEVYGWVDLTLRQQGYQTLKRSGRGLVRRYLEKMTGLSRAQTTRLITTFLGGEEVKAKPYRRHRFAQRYTREDVALLVAVDTAHDTLSGPATQKLLQRAYHDFAQADHERLAGISVAQLYRLRGSARYRERRMVYQPPRPTPVNIGERRRPEPGSRPGYLRVDTVHQGDLAMAKRGSDAADQRGLPAAGARRGAGAVSVPHPGFSFRQRERVHQPYGGPVVEQATDRADQIAAAAQQ